VRGVRVQLVESIHLGCALQPTDLSHRWKVAVRTTRCRSGNWLPFTTYRPLHHGSSEMFRWLIVAATLLAVSWTVLIVLARRLPPGLAKDVATVLPACVTTARRLRTDPRVPRRVKVVVAIAGLWVLSPIDLIPEFLPVVGPLDDIVVVALALRYAARRIPPADPRLLRRLIPTLADEP
jgi:hypothetical protein